MKKWGLRDYFIFLAQGHMINVKIQILSHKVSFSMFSWNVNVLTLYYVQYSPPLKTKQYIIPCTHLLSTYENLILLFTPWTTAAPSRLHCSMFPGSSVICSTRVLISQLLWFIFSICVKEKEKTQYLPC